MAHKPALRKYVAAYREAIRLFIFHVRFVERRTWPIRPRVARLAHIPMNSIAWTLAPDDTWADQSSVWWRLNNYAAKGYVPFMRKGRR